MISVVIPLYNKEKSIAQTLECVLNQTYKDFEVIVVDDGSKDNSAAIVAQFTDTRIHLIRQENGGVSAARNRGIEEAQGKYVAFLDADDVWLTDHLESLVNLIRQYSQCRAWSSNYVNNINGTDYNIILNKIPFKGESGILTNYFEICSCSHPPVCSITTCVEKSLLKEIGGFPVGITSGEDLLTWARIAIKTDWAYTKKATAVYMMPATNSFTERPTRPNDEGDPVCDGVGFLKDAPFVLLCKLFRHKVVIHQHNKGMAKDVDRHIYRWLLPMVYRNTKVILLSWRLYADIEKVVKREQVMICPNGIPDTNSKITSAERHNDVPHILFLSNLIVSKGVLVLLDALKTLKERGCRFVCDFVGGETKELDGRRFALEIEARGLDDIAVYHGRKYGKDKEAFLQTADIFVFPTFYFNECFPLVIIEAMMNGLPVISTDEGGIRDEVKDGKNGFVVKPQDSKVLADAIQRLLDDKNARHTMGAEGRRMFKERFTMVYFENNIKGILIDCIEANDK